MTKSPNRSSGSTQIQDALNRRVFLKHGTSAVGAAALASLLGPAKQASAVDSIAVPPKAKRIIYMFQSGAPSQMDLFDYKPELARQAGKDLPAQIRMGQRLTSMTSGQDSFPVQPSIFKFKQHGQSGMWFSELLPHMAQLADRWCMVRSMFTEAINHDPAITFCQTGSPLAGRPSIGAWVNYGLGSENKDLPAYVVLTSFGTGSTDDQPIYDRLWGAGFLPSKYQGVKFRNTGDAVLYLSNPPGIDSSARRSSLDRIAALNHQQFQKFGDPEIQSRISQYEMAFRMQQSVPELTNLADEPQHVVDMYGPEVNQPGSYAANCLMARRLAERDVRFIQLFHMGWDHHRKLPGSLTSQCSDTDQPTAALIKDLEQRGLLDDTLIVWGGEFGRTTYSQGVANKDYGRDHHPRCFTVLMAGAGIKPGLTYGATDEYCYNVAENPVHVHDLNATILHLLGINHEQLTYKHQGRNFRLTDIHGIICRDILA